MRTSIIIFLVGLLCSTASAQSATDQPSEKEAISIISTHEDIKASFYKIIRITPGRQIEKDGFIHENVLRVTAFAPGSASRPTRGIKHYLLHYSEEYGWYMESERKDARGAYLEISSQKQGRVYLR